MCRGLRLFLFLQEKRTGTAEIRRLKPHGPHKTLPGPLRLRRLPPSLLLPLEGGEKYWKGKSTSIFLSLCANLYF